MLSHASFFSFIVPFLVDTVSSGSHYMRARPPLRCPYEWPFVSRRTRLFKRACLRFDVRAANKHDRNAEKHDITNGRRLSLSIDAARCCRCFAHSENFGLAGCGGQERGTITPRIELGTESAASRRVMLVCDWLIVRGFYQGLLSTRHAMREMTREKTNKWQKFICFI